jgi:replicative DNA helicase
MSQVLDALEVKKTNEALGHRSLPYSLEAEQCVLGGLLLDNEVWEKVIGRLHDKDFYRREHKLIFQAIERLSRDDKPFDVVILSDILETTHQLEHAGGEIYLFELSNNTPSVANIDAYITIVREKSVQRQLLHVTQEIADLAFNPNGRSISELLDIAESKVFAIAEQTNARKGPVAINQIMAKTVDQIDTLYHSSGMITGLPTGFIDLDNKTAGLQAANLIIVAGRPSMGKTAFVMNVVENVVLKAHKPALVFSMEMPAEALAMRMLSSLSHVEQHCLRTGQLNDVNWSCITSSMNLLSEVPLFIDDTPGLSPAEMRARARRVAKEQGSLGLIAIDYLQLMHIPGFKVENRVAEISEISRNLKALAKELNVPVIALSQLNRSLEQRSDRRPIMSDLRESGAIEQDADVIVFIYRDSVYNDSADKEVAEIIIAKQRNGPTGRIRLRFCGPQVKFDNLADQSYEDLAS